MTAPHMPVATRVDAFPVPAGVADDATGRLYLENPAGGIDAVDLDGQQRWRSDLASEPLFADAQRLIGGRVSGRGLVIVVLDAASGAVVGRAGPLDMGADRWAMVSVALEDGVLVIRWLVSPRRKGPDFGRQEDPTYQVARADLRTGDVTTRTAAMPTRMEGPEAELPEGFAPLAAQDGSPAVWTSVGQRAAVGVDAGRSPQPLLLLTQTNGRWKRTRLMSRAPAFGFVTPFIADRGRAIALLVTNEEPTDGRPVGSVVRWQVFSVPEGALIGAWPHEEGAALPPAVLGRRLLYGVSVHRARLVRCVDLAGGRVAWSRPVRSLALEPREQ